MKIALIAPFEERVPPLKYGGVEAVIYVLAEELHKLGHDVTVFATGDSKISAKLIPIVSKPIGSGLRKRVREALTYKALTDVIGYLQKEKFDIIHNHIGWQALLFRNMYKAPVLTTIHWVLDNTCENKMYDLHKDMPFVSISKNQRKPLPRMNYQDTIYHGIQLERFTYNDKPDDYLAFLGRFSSFKGSMEAIKIAKKSGKKLIMAAKINEFERDYFEKEIQPLIDGKQIIYLGEVGFAEKIKLLRNAKALLNPVQWAEPFGLTNIEAMACGTPVIGSKFGALPEIIVNNKTGFLCDTIDEMVEKVQQLDKLNRADCRAHVEAKFSAQTMTENYLKVYEQLAGQKQLALSGAATSKLGL